MKPTSFSTKRALTLDDNSLWTIPEMLRYVADQVEKGEVGAESALLLLYDEEDDGSRLRTFRAKVDHAMCALMLAYAQRELTNPVR